MHQAVTSEAQSVLADVVVAVLSVGKRDVVDAVVVNQKTYFLA